MVIRGRENSKMGPNMSISWDTAVFSIFSHMLMWVLLRRDLADIAKVLSQSVHLQIGRSSSVGQKKDELLEMPSPSDLKETPRDRAALVSQ